MISKFLNKNARVPICGFIQNIIQQISLVKKRLSMFLVSETKPKHRFFVVTEWLNQFEKATSILRDIKNDDIKFRETITSGFENARKV